MSVSEQHFDNWPRKYPLCVHAESQTTAAVLLLATLHNRPIHICHVARKEEIQIIRAAKEKVWLFINISYPVIFHL
jgi:carbamoyl-phosphate synthase/aspartate carbamoyltransferase/dihydroorotase